MSASHPAPQKVKLHRVSQVLELVYGSETFELPAEYLRVFSPSAEVRGHGPGQEQLQYGKQGVAITGIEAAGNYAIRLVFSDGHDSGIYAWSYLYELGQKQEANWQDYLQQLKDAGKTREPGVEAVRLMDPGGGCGGKH